MEKKRTVAIFDFDGTLTTSDTLLLFICYVHGIWRTLAGFLLYLPFLVLMKLQLYSNGGVKEKIFSHFFNGMKYKDFILYGNQFAKKKKHILRNSLSDILYSHLQQGHSVYIITASIVEWVKPFYNNVTVIGTQVEVDNKGILTGRFSTPNCYGQEKVRRLLEVEPDRNEYTLCVYGDSRGDAELMEMADEKHWLQGTDRVGEFLRFCVVGAIATAIDALVFYMAIPFMSYPIALILGYGISLLFNYFLTILWTFREQPTLQNAIGIVTAHIINLFVVRMGLMRLFINILSLPTRIAFLPTLAISVVTNFFIVRYFVKQTFNSK